MRKAVAATITALAIGCSSFGTTASTTSTTDAGAPDANTSEAAPIVGADGGDAGPAYGPYRTAVMADAPIAYFGLGDVETEPGHAILDEVTHTRMGDLVGTPIPTPLPEAVDDHLGLLFDGLAAIVLPPDVYGFFGIHPFTIELWMRPSATDFAHLFTCQQRGNPKMGYAIYYNDNVNGERWVSDTPVQDEDGTAPLAEFTHVALVYDGGHLALYVNGVLFKSGDDNAVLGTHHTPTYIGASAIDGATGTASDGFHGVIDEVAIFDKALEAQAIANHYKAR